MYMLLNSPRTLRDSQSNADLNRSRVSRMVSLHSGRLSRNHWRSSLLNGALTPPGTAQEGCTRLPPSRLMTSWPNALRRMPLRARSGLACTRPTTLRVAGS